MKKSKNKILIDEERISQFNKVSSLLKNKEYSRVEMLKILHDDLGYAKADCLLSAFCDGVNPPVIKVKRGRYAFNPKPVYKDRLQLALDTYTRKANPQCYDEHGNYKSRITINDAIKLLKSNGYKIFKPITEYKEI